MNKKNPPPFTFRPSPVRMIYQALISTKKKESNVKNVTKKEKKETPRFIHLLPKSGSYDSSGTNIYKKKGK